MRHGSEDEREFGTGLRERLIDDPARLARAGTKLEGEADAALMGHDRRSRLAAIQGRLESCEAVLAELNASVAAITAKLAALDDALQQRPDREGRSGCLPPGVAASAQGGEREREDEDEGDDD